MKLWVTGTNCSTTMLGPVQVSKGGGGWGGDVIAQSVRQQRSHGVPEGGAEGRYVWNLQGLQAPCCLVLF